MIEAMGGRKFILTLICIAVGTAVQILSPNGVTEAFTALLIGTSAAFGATNAFVSAKGIAANAIKGAQLVETTETSDRIETSVTLPPAADLSAVDEELAAHASKIDEQSRVLEGISRALIDLNKTTQLTAKAVTDALTR